MKIKLRNCLFIFILLIAANWGLAQTTVVSPTIENPPPAKTKKIKLRTRSILPRRQTKLQFDRFKQDVDLEKKLTDSNKMLY